MLLSVVMREIVGADHAQRRKEHMNEQGCEEKSGTQMGGGRSRRREDMSTDEFGIRGSENSTVRRGQRREPEPQGSLEGPHVSGKVA